MSNFDDIFESTPQTDEFDKEAWAAKKKAERDEVYALTDATAEAVCADGGKFREYLDVQAAFRNYSATNALLILATKPDARRLGDKDFWRDQGVYIKRQAFGHPIKIVESNGEYTRDDGSIGVSYNIKRVYDISQTTARTRAPQAVSHDARALLNALIYKRPAPVQSVDELPNGMNAVYDREQNAVFCTPWSFGKRPVLRSVQGVGASGTCPDRRGIHRRKRRFQGTVRFLYSRQRVRCGCERLCL